MYFMNTDSLPKVPCQIPQLNLSCYGCCGRDFKDKQSVEKDLEKNTKEFRAIQKHPTQFKLMQFRDRLSPNPDDVTQSGLCSNVVKFNSKCTACPLHPLINSIVEKEEYNFPFNKQKHSSQKRDPRQTYCDINYECATYKHFKHFSPSQIKEFVQWVKKNNYDNYSYSMENGDDVLIHKFIKTRSNN